MVRAMEPTTPPKPADDAAPNLEAKLAEIQKQHEAAQATIAKQAQMLEQATAALNAVVEEKANQVPGTQAPAPAPAADPNGPPAWFTGWAQQFAGNIEARFGQLGSWQQEQQFNQLVQQNGTPAEVVKIANDVRAQQVKLGRPINAETAETYAWGIYAKQQEAERRKTEATRSQFNVPMPTFGAPRGYQPPSNSRPVFKNTAEEMAWLEQAVGDQPLGGH
jgi:hypothetical protein